MVSEIQIEEAGESAIQRNNTRRKCAVQQRRQTSHALAIKLQIDSGIFIGCFGHSHRRCVETARGDFTPRIENEKGACLAGPFEPGPKAPHSALGTLPEKFPQAVRRARMCYSLEAAKIGRDDRDFPL